MGDSQLAEGSSLGGRTTGPRIVSRTILKESSTRPEEG